MDEERECSDQSGTPQNQDGILYDLSYLIEWPDEKEVVRPNQIDEIPPGIIYSGARSLKSWISRSVWTTIRAVGIPVMPGAPCTLPLDLIKLINSQMSWSMSRSPDGNFVAIIKEDCVEIRSRKDDYNVLLGHCKLSKDPHPQWRTISWNQQSTVIAFSESDGTVHVCDIKGIVIFTFDGHLTEDQDNFDCSNSICVLQFLESSALSQDAESLVLLVVSYSGAATCLEINQNYDKGYKVAFQFDFSQYHSKGVSAVCYSKDHELLIVGGCTGYAVDAVSVPKATKFGLSAWRLISDEPFVQPLDVFNDVDDSARKRNLLRRLSVVPSEVSKKLRGEVIDGVYVMSVSPCRQLLAVIHLSGAISVWEIPSFRQKKLWRIDEQPFYNGMRTDSSDILSSSRRTRSHPLMQNGNDCKWWNDSALIIARCSGSLAVVSSSGENLESLFGDDCEWLEPAPQISFCRDEGFLAMECETNVQPLKRQRENSEDKMESDDMDDEDFNSIDDSDEEESTGVVQKLKNNTKSALYSWTEVEYFRPPRKRPKLVRKSYRLLSITQTTPEKLFEKRLEDEEYGEALALAQRYNLDGDKVFQRQWKKSSVSIASIQDYLRKVTKRSWVMHECCERVPDNLDAARELLKFALSVTDIDELAKLSTSQDSSNDQSESDSDYEDEYDGFDVEEQRNQEIKKRNKFVKKWSKELDFTHLTLPQKEMVRARKRIIKYMDRLSTYECLLGGYDAARERYSKEKFADFRQQNMFTSALEYARNGNWKALDTLLTYHGDELRDHRLALLSNIPKTVPPSEYKCLLPFVNEDGSVECWQEVKHRDPEDWCERTEYSVALTPLTSPSDPATEFYQENSSLSRFKISNPSSDLVTDWFLYQAELFDSDARDIDGALELLNIGTENYVDGLKEMTRDYKTLDTLVYECDYDPSLTLVRLQSKSKLERLKMLMETSSKEMYVKNFHRWALPFLKTCDEESAQASKIFENYIKELAENDLTLPSLILTSFLESYSMPIQISSTEDLARLARDCIYMNSNPDQLGTAKKIHGVLMKLDNETLKSDGNDRIKKLENHIYTCSILAGYGVKVTPEYVREVESDRTSVQKLLLRLSRTVGGRCPALNKSEWKSFLKSMLQLRDKVFSKTCDLEAAICFEVFVESLLTSGNIQNFQIASEHMMRTSDEEHEAARRLLGTSQQKLSYESSVALVIKSSQEYFDASSPTTNDNMLGLARECLLLITDRPDSVREKLDLIEGVVLLQKFGVNKLPLQVRLTEDKLSLISKAIEEDVEAYKKTEPLLRLAMLFRVSGDNKNDRKGKVLTMIVEKALLQNDLNCAYCLCLELISMPFESAWQVCLKLANRDDFEDAAAKGDILAFVACHCDESKLPEVMERIGFLNLAILKKVIEEPEVPTFADPVENQNQQLAEENGVEEPTSGGMSLKKMVHSSAEFLSPTNVLKNTMKGSKAMLSATGSVLSATGTVLSATSSTTKAVLSNVKNTEWWKSTIDKTLSSIPMPDMEMNDANELASTVNNTDFEKAGCPEFYAEILENSVNKYGLKISDEMFSISKEISLSQAMLRAGYLDMDCKNPSSGNRIDILENLVDQILPYDFALGISYLLVFEDLDRAYKCLKKFPVSAFSLQLALYYFSLRLTEEVNYVPENDEKSALYDIPPVTLIKQALEFISNHEFSGKSRQTKIVAYIRQLQEQMFDFAQGERLQQLGRGIDVGRFTSDVEYRNETILGLAMTMDDEQYKIAVSSAHRSGTDLWMVLMAHLEHLFTECQDQLDCVGLEDRINKLNMIPELIKRPDAFFQRMDTCVFPFIDGKDLDRFLLYFTLLSKCVANEKSFVSQLRLCKLSPSNHAKILKKIKSVSPGLDYKALISDEDPSNLCVSGHSRVIAVLLPVLDTKNVQMFAKLMPQIPYSNFSITASSIYFEFTKKIMWKDVDNSSAEGSMEDISWITRYDSCSPYLRMCHPHHLLSFFDETLFSSELSKIIVLGVRQDLIKRGVKLCKFQINKERKNELDNIVSSSGQSFDSVLPDFVRMSRHLDSYSTSFISNLLKQVEYDQNSKKYLDQYDASQSKPNLVLELAVSMLLDGMEPDFVRNFLAVVPGNSWTCKDVLSRCIESIVPSLSTPEEKESAISRLEVIVKTISKHEKLKGNILSSSQVIDLLRPFCSDVSIDARIRVDVLKLLEDQFELEDSEARLLLLHRTEAVIRESWGEEACEKVFENITADEIIEDKNRYEIFQMLLSIGELTIKKSNGLASLLEIWPVFKSNETRNECWRSVLLALTRNGTDGGKALVELTRNQAHLFTLPTVRDVFHELTKHKMMFYAIKVALLANFKELQSDLISTMSSVMTMGPSQCDEELIELMLKNSVAVHSVDTLYFAKVVEYLLSGECPDAEHHVHGLARQLQDLGHIAEAGTLLLNFRGTHPAFRTFNNSLSSLKRWLNS